MKTRSANKAERPSKSSRPKLIAYQISEDDFDRIVERCPLELAAVYFDRFEEHPLDDARTGADGNLYHVLRRRDA